MLTIKQIKDFCILLKRLFILVVKIVFVVVWTCVLWVIPKKKKCVKGQVVLITGAGHGFGEVLAKKFATLQAKVVLWDINEKSVVKVASEITNKGFFAKAYTCDVTNEADVQKTAKKVFTDIGDVDILINNAGVLQNLPIEDLNSSGIRRTFDVNILSHFWTIRAFLPKMIQNNNGHLVSISSYTGLIGKMNMTDYSATKFAVVGMIESILQEIRAKGKRIRCTVICPVTINTGLLKFPVTNHSSLAPILEVDEAAEAAIDAILKEKLVVTIPKSLQLLVTLKKLLPRTATHLIFDFIDYCQVPNQKLP